MKSNIRLFSFLLFASSFCAIAFAKPTRFEFKDAGLRNLVHFSSETPLEKVVGLSNFVSGWAEMDPDRLQDGVKAEFEVDVRTFETGIDSRNEMLRDKLLGSSENPIGTFTVQRFLSLSRHSLTDNQPVTARAEGILKLKGGARPMTMLVNMVFLKENETTKQRLPGNLIKMSASFDLDISQYGVPLPEALKLRFSKYVQVSVDALGTDRLPSLALPRAEIARAKSSDGRK